MPKSKASEPMDEKLYLRAGKAEKAEWKTKAKESGLPLGRWISKVLNMEAGDGRGAKRTQEEPGARSEAAPDNARRTQKEGRKDGSNDSGPAKRISLGSRKKREGNPQK